MPPVELDGLGPHEIAPLASLDLGLGEGPRAHGGPVEVRQGPQQQEAGPFGLRHQFRQALLHRLAELGIQGIFVQRVHGAWASWNSEGDAAYSYLHDISPASSLSTMDTFNSITYKEKC